MVLSYHERRAKLSTMVALTWSIRLQSGTILAIGLFLLVVVGMSQAARSCPRDVIAEANKCLTDYSSHSKSMYNSRQKLCCGVDVETLRAFCHYYSKAIRCIGHLKHICPETTHSSIDHVLVNLDGAMDSLDELCADDRFIESYAMHQSCFTNAGRGSEACFHAHLRDSTSIQFLSTVDIPHKDQFCSDMRKIVRCVKKNVALMCGEAASNLTSRLIKPMIRKSSDCDYSVITPPTHSPEQKQTGGTHFISDEGSRANGHHTGKQNGNPSSKRGSGHNSANTLSTFFIFHNILLTFLSFVLVFLLKSYTVNYCNKSRRICDSNGKDTTSFQRLNGY